jgi:hypothetical protein
LRKAGREPGKTALVEQVTCGDFRGRCGLAQCAICGGGLYVTSRSHGRQRAYFYACTSFHRKRQTACPNNRQMAMAEADGAVMEAVQDELLDPAVMTQAVREAAETLIASPARVAARLAALEDRQRDNRSVIARLTAAISAGGELASLVAELETRDQERLRLEQERQQLTALTGADRLDLRRVERDLLQRVNEWRVAASRNVSQGRQVIRKLLGSTRVTMTPLADGACELSGRADYGKLFSGIVVATAVASPTRHGWVYKASASHASPRHRPKPDRRTVGSRGRFPRLGEAA